MQDKNYEMTEPKVSLHWINYNTKQILKELRTLVQINMDLRSDLGAAKKASAPGSYPQQSYSPPPQEELPF